MSQDRSRKRSIASGASSFKDNWAAAGHEDQLKLLAEAVAMFPPGIRGTAELCLLRGVSPSGAAFSLGVPRRLIDVHLVRARQRICKLLGLEWETRRRWRTLAED